MIIDNNITKDGILEFSENLSYITKLSSLSFSGTDVDDKGLEYMVNNISSIKYLQEYYVSSIFIIMF